MNMTNYNFFFNSLDKIFETPRFVRVDLFSIKQYYISKYLP